MVLDFAYKSALQLTELIRTRRASPVEIVTESLDDAGTLNPK